MASQLPALCLTKGCINAPLPGEDYCYDCLQHAHVMCRIPLLQVIQPAMPSSPSRSLPKAWKTVGISFLLILACFLFLLLGIAMGASSPSAAAHDNSASNAGQTSIASNAMPNNRSELYSFDNFNALYLRDMHACQTAQDQTGRWLCLSNSQPASSSQVKESQLYEDWLASQRGDSWAWQTDLAQHPAWRSLTS